MRTITKGAEPRALLDWKRENQASPENLHYEGGGFPRKEVCESLLKEQHYLCAYTLKSLTSADKCHIEHVLPQSKHSNKESIDYRNMLACHPAGNISCEYGAVAKADYDPANHPFLSPLHPTTSEQFRFYEDGTLVGLTPDACACIDVLNLEHPTLKDDRAAAIRGYLQPKTRYKLTAAQARRLAERINLPDSQGKLTAYCTAIAQAAIKFADREERKAARMKNKPKNLN